MAGVGERNLLREVRRSATYANVTRHSPRDGFAMSVSSRAGRESSQNVHEEVSFDVRLLLTEH